MSVAIELEKLNHLRDSGAITPEEFEQSKTRLLDQCVHRIEAFYDGKTPALPSKRLPRAKVVRGIVQSIRFSGSEADQPYTAFLNVDGQGAEINSPSPICIESGDRVLLGGYECDGRLLTLAYHNESNGTYSDLSRLRRGYRFMLMVGGLSVLAGIAVMAGVMIVPILQTPMGRFGDESWGYVRYLLAGLAAVIVSGLGVGLFFLGARAKQFHDAMASYGSVSFTGHFRRLPALRT